MREYELIINTQEREVIMNTTNGHDPLLVEAINKHVYNTTLQPMFASILYTIACRDWYEVETNVLQDGFTMKDIQNQHTDPMAFFDAYGHEVLMNVCDDNDLKTILSFCGVDPYDTNRPDSKYNVEIYTENYYPVSKTTMLMTAPSADVAVSRIDEFINEKLTKHITRIVVTEITYQQARDIIL